MKEVTMTLRDCVRALAKDFGLIFEPVDEYPDTFAFRSNRISMKIYRLPDGQIRMQIIPLDDVINDKYVDIDTLNDLFRALEPWRQFIETKQMSLFGWAA